jgi:hypothetical protein
MTKRFTSGGVGRFTFETANRLLDAADRIDALPNGIHVFGGRNRAGNVLARLTTSLGTEYFDADGETSYEVWEWVGIQIMDGDGQSGRKIDDYLAVGSNYYDGATKGLAVCLTGKATINEIVNLFPMTNAMSEEMSGERWFGFFGYDVTGLTTLLKITSAEQIIDGLRYKYSVSPRAFNHLGNAVANVLLPGGIAFNTYEYATESDGSDWGHGQLRDFPSGRLSPVAVRGHVVGVLTQRAKIVDDVALPNVYAFEAVMPMSPVCGASPVPATGFNERAIRTLLEEGIA